MLTDKVAWSFDSKVRSRGVAYAQQGAVMTLRVDEDSASGIVIGSDEYDVIVRRLVRPGAWDLNGSCTCPYLTDHGEPCKHLWALLKVAEKKAQAKWGMPPRNVTFSVGLADEEENDLDETPKGIRGLKEEVCVVGQSRGGSKTTLRLGKAGPLVIVSRDVAERALESSDPEPWNDRSGAKWPRKRQRAKVPAWHRMLEETIPCSWAGRDGSVRKQESPIDHDIWYVIDGHRSRLNEAIVIELMRPNDRGGNGAGEAVERLTLARLALVSGDIGRIHNQADRAICALLVGAARPGREYAAYSGWSRRSASEQRAAHWQLDPRMAPLVMPMMEGTGRLLWRITDGSGVRPASWSPGTPWDLVIELHPDPAAKRNADARAMFRAALRRGEERLPLVQALTTNGEPGAVIHQGQVSPLHVAGGKSGGALSWARSIAHRTPTMVDRADLAGLLEGLEQKGMALPVLWPEEWGVKRMGGLTPRARLVLRKERENGRSAPPDRLLAEVEFDYEGTRVGSGSGRYVPVTLAGGDAAMVERDPDIERRAVERFTELGGKHDAYHGLHVPAKRVPAVAAGLLSDGWEVVGEQAAYRRPGAVDVRVKSGIDWFDLEGGVRFGGESATIGAVLAALRKGEKFIALGDGSLGLLPETWLARHGKWLGLGREESGAVRFSRAQLTLVDALLAEMPEATCDAQTRAARTKLRAFEGVAPRTEPAGFRGSLRPYQRQGLGWLHFLAEFGLGGCLADDMGLGKTVQLLAHIEDRRANADGAGPWLVVAPKSLIFNWAREAARFTPGLRVLGHTGAERGRSAADLARADLVLTTYATMRLDIEMLRTVEFACIVLDEAQAIKTADSQAAKAARLLRCRRRLALTGTPVENRIEDLWSIFEFLNPGMLGSSGAFRDALRRRSAGEGTDGGGKEAMEVLRRALRPFLLRRTKEVVAPELPARSEQTVRCELEGRQKKLYDDLRTHYRTQLLGRVDREGMRKSGMHVLEALLRLRQAACHPGLIEPKDAPRRRARQASATPATRVPESAKVQTLVEMLEELGQEGHKALVFSQFTSLLTLVKVELDRRKIAFEELDGSTSAKEREVRVDRFQRLGVKEGGKGVFLISLKAGGVGLNLTAASYVFLLDPWWNPAVEAQAIDRSHRIGQDKRVMAYRLIASGTVEERILELQERKRELAAAIVSENDGPLSAMTREDLEWLLS